jgi:hypothetical protein
MFEPAWSTRTVEDDPGAPFFNETTKYVVSGTLTNGTWDGAAPGKLELAASDSYPNGVLYLAYRPEA